METEKPLRFVEENLLATRLDSFGLLLLQKKKPKLTLWNRQELPAFLRFDLLPMVIW